MLVFPLPCNAPTFMGLTGINIVQGHRNNLSILARFDFSDIIYVNVKKHRREALHFSDVESDYSTLSIAESFDLPRCYLRVYRLLVQDLLK